MAQPGFDVLHLLHWRTGVTKGELNFNGGKLTEREEGKVLEMLELEVKGREEGNTVLGTEVT